jgi:hypothetical protein
MRGTRRLLAMWLTVAGCTVDVAPVSVEKLVIGVRGDHQRGFERALLRDSIVVAVKSPQGDAVAGVRVSFAPSGGGVVSPSSSVTDARGIASTAWQLGGGTSQQSLTAFVGNGPSERVAMFQAVAARYVASPPRRARIGASRHLDRIGRCRARGSAFGCRCRRRALATMGRAVVGCRGRFS